MASMHPLQLRADIIRNPKFRAEVAVFNALQLLPDGFHVFHNRAVKSKNAFRAYERPIDFTVVNEQLGILFIEVKGGRIRITERGGFEQFLPDAGRWNSINPFDQLKLAVRELISAAKKAGAKYWIPDDCCVIFPDTRREALRRQATHLPSGTLCSEDVAELSSIIPTLFSEPRKSTAFTPEQFSDIRDRLNNMPEADPAALDVSPGLANAAKSKDRSTKMRSAEPLESWVEQNVWHGRVWPRLKQELKHTKYYRGYSPTKRGRPKHLGVRDVLIALVVFLAVVIGVSFLTPGSPIPSMLINSLE